MAKFRYAYEKIVGLKASEKRQAEWMLSDAIGKLQTEQMSLDQLRSERKQWEERLLELSAAAVSLSELTTIQHYLDHLDSCIMNKIAEVHQAKGVVEQSRSHLGTKMKDEKVWLQAKEREFYRFRQASLVQEQNELDEMATVRFMIAAP
ncbi:flagellar export protein FliJ [Paenibacillus sp. MMS18-CY102]|uniref:flagellar export protein FliJ n=1 Tax=Paenibacillus sp. MMS18-CY102 TaxID=2682849 RepID=UPI001365E74E|nr:flagellar export protein FliJ [Paenibacillus sp. MMS18-CY102]MWC26567.1 flagellar export protein FliJ [Paenibacillus sp. MMS18-CY102]